ncbi:hypothetical protein EGW08_012777, partial [Elysia chlorotica]
MGLLTAITSTAAASLSTRTTITKAKARPKESTTTADSIPPPQPPTRATTAKTRTTDPTPRTASSTKTIITTTASPASTATTTTTTTTASPASTATTTTATTTPPRQKSLIMLMLCLLVPTSQGVPPPPPPAVPNLEPYSSTTSASTTTVGPGGGWEEPEIRLGEFFYISFPDPVAEQFIACLCDAASQSCSVQYKLRENQTSTDFPFRYRVLSLRQARLPANDSRPAPQDPSPNPYLPYFVCDVLNFVPGEDIACVRQRASDDACGATGKCQSYSANFTLAGCGFECSQLAWLSAFTVPITYSGFEHLVSVSPNTTCLHSDGDDGGGDGGGDDNDGVTTLGLAVGLASVALVAGLVALTACLMCRRRQRLGKPDDSSKSKPPKPNSDLDPHSNGSHNRGFQEGQSHDQE